MGKLDFVDECEAEVEQGNAVGCRSIRSHQAVARMATAASGIFVGLVSAAKGCQVAYWRAEHALNGAKRAASGPDVVVSSVQRLGLWKEMFHEPWKQPKHSSLPRPRAGPSGGKASR